MKKALIILGGGIGLKDLKEPSRCRVELAIDLCQKEDFDYIIPSSKYSYQLGFKPSSTIAIEMQKELIKAHIPPEKIIIENESRDTITNIYNTKKILEAKECYDIIFVTSSFQEEKLHYLCQKILGSKYKVKYAIANNGLSKEDLAKQIINEKEALEKYKKIFKDIEDGDDEMVRQVLVTNKHPDFVTNPSSFWYATSLSPFHQHLNNVKLKI